MKHYLTLILLFFFTVLASHGQEQVKISLLTVEPRSNEVYTIFGHTALRVVDTESNRDVVFNWGTFNFSESNFIYRFMRGETDYRLSVYDYGLFYLEYYSSGSTVIEQELNFTDRQKREVLNMLNINMQPENLIYRYNFLFDNCTTRVRDIIQKACDDDLQYNMVQEGVTFRDLIHSCTEPYPWLSFGIDLIIGNGADSLIHLQQEMFLPEKLMLAMDNAYTTSAGGERVPVVASRTVLMQSDSKSPKHYFWDSPLIIGIIICCLFLILIYIGVKKKITWRVPFALLFFTASVGGCIVFFLVFFSIHPCVSPNWNLLWLHPLHLIAVTGFFFKKSYPLFYCYHIANFVLLCGLLLAWFLTPQQLPAAAIPYILTLLAVSGFTVYRNKRRTT